jgi:hypothetical protein
MAENNTDNGFSYAGDIEPLMGKYFSMAANSGASSPVQLSFLQGQRQKLETQEARSLELKARGLELEKTKIAIDEARRKSIGMQENMGALNELEKTLDFGLTKVPEEQRPVFIARAGVRFGSLIGTDDRAKASYDAAVKGIPTLSSKDTRAEKITNNMFDALDDVEFGKDYSGKQTDTFKDQGSAGKVQRVISNFGTPEEKQGAADLTASEQLDVARRIRERRDAAILQGGQQQKQQGPRSLYTTQTSP